METSKIAMAKDILASVRQEFMARPFEEIANQLTDPTIGVDQDMNPLPITTGKVIDVQKRYGHREFILTLKGKKKSEKIIQVDAKIEFVGRGNKTRSEVMSFMAVSEK
jgi:hypothetical protein